MAVVGISNPSNPYTTPYAAPLARGAATKPGNLPRRSVATATTARAVPPMRTGPYSLRRSYSSATAADAAAWSTAGAT